MEVAHDLNMKSALILVLSISAAFFTAAAQTVRNPPAEQGQEVKKLGSLTWDLDAHKLVWVVQKGKVVNDHFVPASEERYEISPDEATMTTSGEKRGFEAAEAESLQKLLDVLSVYCAESVVWWDQGEGTPLGPDGSNPSRHPGQGKPALKPGEKPVKVQDQQPPRPAYKIPDGQLIAMAHRL